MLKYPANISNFCRPMLQDEYIDNDYRIMNFIGMLLW